MRKKWSSNQFYIVTLITSLTLYIVIVGFIVHLFGVATRKHLIVVGEKTTVAAVNEVNQFLKENIDAVQVESDAVEFILQNGGDISSVENYFKLSTEDYLNKINSSFTGFYGYINGEYVDGTGWIPDEDYNVKSRPWYKEAVAANGVPVITPPYDDLQSGEIRISAVRLLSDRESVVAVDVSLAKIMTMVNEIHEGGNGDCIILDNDGCVAASSRNDIRVNYLTGEAGKDYMNLVEKIYDKDSLTEEVRLDGEKYFAFANKSYSGWYSLLLVPKNELFMEMRKDTLIACTASLVLMLLLLFFCNYSNRKRKDTEDIFKEVNAISGIYVSMSEIDLDSREYKHINCVPHLMAVFSECKSDAQEEFKRIGQITVVDEYQDAFYEFTDLTTLRDRFSQINSNTVTYEFVGRSLGWCRSRFVIMDYTTDHKPKKVLFAVESIDQAKKEEERLISESTVDKLTGCFNRKAYEETINYYMINPMEEDVVYFSMDVNELKAINDDLGHAVGDELIKGIAACMQQALKPYGKVFRAGGDEFFAVIRAKKEFVEGIYEDLVDRIDKWHGKTLKNGSASIGYAAHADFPELNIRELAKRADKFMYEDKDRYYRSKGIDRRGQQEAYSAICSLYKKILLVNLTNDTYQTVHMDLSEQTSEMGFKDSFSEWISAFCESGQVAPEDKESFLEMLSLDNLRKIFAEENGSVKFKYRRKINGEFANVGMEIKKSPKYTPVNQTVYLYLKVVE